MYSIALHLESCRSLKSMYRAIVKSVQVHKTIVATGYEKPLGASRCHPRKVEIDTGGCLGPGPASVMYPRQCVSFDDQSAFSAIKKIHIVYIYSANTEKKGWETYISQTFRTQTDITTT